VRRKLEEAAWLSRPAAAPSGFCDRVQRRPHRQVQPLEDAPARSGRGAIGLGKGYTDSAQPISSNMPKPATAGPNMACQRDGRVCAGCSSLWCLAIVSSQSPRREISATAASLSCSNKVVLRLRRHPHPGQQVAPPLDCSAERLMPRPREDIALRVVTGWLAQRVLHQTLMGPLEAHLRVASRRAGREFLGSCFLQDHTRRAVVSPKY
jgi:hypothetical protein